MSIMAINPDLGRIIIKSSIKNPDPEVVALANSKKIREEKQTKPNFLRKYIDIITESEAVDSLISHVQELINNNPYLKDNTVTPQDLVMGKDFVLYFSDDAAQHIKERHGNSTKPGSLFSSNIDLKKVAGYLLNQSPSEHTGGRVKWLGVEAGQIVGEMGVAYADPKIVAGMTDYTMPDGGREQVKIKIGKRKPTREVSMITSELGQLEDGRTVISLITMFPGGQTVAGKAIPMNRNDFAQQGFYFPVSK